MLNLDNTYLYGFQKNISVHYYLKERNVAKRFSLDEELPIYSISHTPTLSMIAMSFGIISMMVNVLALQAICTLLTCLYNGALNLRITDVIESDLMPKYYRVRHNITSIFYN